MVQPAQVRFEERAQIGDAVFQHRHPLDPEPEREALVAGGIDAAVLQHLRIHHAAAEDLQPVVAVADAELAGQIKEAVERLPGEQKEAIVLREYHDMNYEEISQVLQCSLEKVKVLIFRARENLRKELRGILKEVR